MRSWTDGNGITRRLLSIAATASLAIVLVGPAFADGGREMKGESFLEGKNDQQRTLQLEETLVRVTDDTRIYDGDSKRITFETIPSPKDGIIVVEFEGEVTGRDQVVASRLVVRRQPN
jgi:hypothetical protein